MKDGKFEASDFDAQSGIGDTDDISEIANALLPTLQALWLEDLLRDAPVAYGKPPEMVPLALPWDWSTDKCIDGSDTYQARLICIEAIELGNEYAAETLAELDRLEK